MKKNWFILFSILSLHISAQYSDKPKDFYVTKQGDTTYGTYISGMKYDGFKNLKGEKIKLKPDSIKYYSIYEYNSDRSDYSTRSWISINDKFYEYYYKGYGKVSIVSTAGDGFGPTPSWEIAPKYEIYYFLRADTLSHFFLPANFYKAAQSFLSDCPTISDYLDHAPNKYNKEKSHKATLEDAVFVIPKYNECMKH